MLFFLIALVLSVLGVGAYAYSNPGAHDITLRDLKITGLPDWLPVAIAVGVILIIFMVQAIYSSLRIAMLKRANARMARELEAGALQSSEPTSGARPLQPTDH